MSNVLAPLREGVDQSADYEFMLIAEGLGAIEGVDTYLEELESELGEEPEPEIEAPQQRDSTESHLDTEEPSNAKADLDKRHVRDFITKVAKHGLLTADEEKSLATQIQAGKAAATRLQTGEYFDEETKQADIAIAQVGEKAFDRMRNCNMLLTIAPAARWHRRYKHRGGGLNRMEFIQEGVRGIERAIEKFDPAKGYKFSTYGMTWINNFMQRYAQNAGDTIRMPIARYVDNSLVNYENLRAAGKSEEEIAEEMEIDEKVHSQLQAAYQAQHVGSLDWAGVTDEGESAARYAFIGDPRSQQEFEAVHTDSSDEKNQLGSVYDALIQIFPAASVWAYIKYNDGEVLNSTDAKRVSRMKDALEHPAVQRTLHSLIGIETPWQDAACASDPVAVLRTKSPKEREELKEACITCPVLEKCQELVEEKRPTGGVWAGVTRTKQSYKTDGAAARLGES